MTNSPTSFASLSNATTLVTVTYADRIDYLHELLRRAFDIEKVTNAVTVSNASISDLRLLEEQWGERLLVIRLKENTGSANGYAVGIAAALAGGASFVWLMDDDNAPKSGALASLHRRLAHNTITYGGEKAAVLGFRPTHQADIACGVDVSRAYPPRSSFFGFHYRQIAFKIWRRVRNKKVTRPSASLVTLPYAPYGGLLASGALFKRIGLPKRELVLYADDTEYTRRITSNGGVIELVTEAHLEDLEGSWNLKGAHPNAFIGWLSGGSNLRAFYAARNQTWFDRNVWANSDLEYRLNRLLFLTILKYFSLITGQKERYELLREAILAGETPILGVSEAYPLQ